MRTSDVGADTIDFNISGSPPFTISPTSALPVITGPVTLDATTQTGFTGTPIVEFDGTSAATSDGFSVDVGGAGSAIRGFAINRFSRGIHVSGAGGVEIKGNYIGTDVTGTIDLGNTVYGVVLNVATNAVVGGTTAADRNVISGTENGLGLIVYLSSGVVVQGNYIGTTADGSTALPNGYGMQVIGSSALPATNNEIVDNVVSGSCSPASTSTPSTPMRQLEPLPGQPHRNRGGRRDPIGNGGAASRSRQAPAPGSTTILQNMIANNAGDGVEIGSGNTSWEYHAEQHLGQRRLGIDLSVIRVTDNDGRRSRQWRKRASELPRDHRGLAGNRHRPSKGRSTRPRARPSTSSSSRSRSVTAPETGKGRSFLGREQVTTDETGARRSRTTVCRALRAAP